MYTRWNQSRPQGFNAIHTNFYEFPSSSPDAFEVWCYTDAITYAPGETVSFHVNTTAKTYSLSIIRDGANPETVYENNNLKGEHYPTAADCYVKGCGWPVAHQWRIPNDIVSGGYIVLTRIENSNGEIREHEHFFVIRSSQPGKQADILLVCATATWTAYNSWGGGNHYESNVVGADINEMAPNLSLKRPWARGQIVLPIGAPRTPLDFTPEKGAHLRYPNIEWAYLMGYSKYYSAAGWASFERNFVVWAENNGFALDYSTQHDLQFRPELLKNYKCVVVVGHDEYWSGEMRDAIDAYVDSGGNIARFGANFIWQIRLEEEGTKQVCYKYFAPERDPLRESHPEKLTHSWDNPITKRPEATTFGLRGTYSVYVGVGGWNPRNAKGFTVYRPKHWAFEGTDLYFGDTFGSEARIFAYEVDGVDFTFQDGLPYPTYKDGAPDGLEILAMGVSANEEEDHNNHGSHLYAGSEDLHFITETHHGDTSAESLDKCRYGAGMVACFTRNGGTVFNAGSVEWVNGLRLKEPMTEQITRNVLTKLTKVN